MLSILMTALLSIYYGIEGGLALSIETPIKEYDFFIKKATPQLQAFIAFVSNSLSGNQIGFYFQISEQEWNEARLLGFYEPKRNGIKLSNSLPSSQENNIILEIILKDLPFEVKYELQKEGSLAPMIYDKIPLHQIKKI